MRFSFVKLLFKIIGTELLFKEAIRFFHKEVDTVKEEFSKKISKFIIKGLLWLVIGTLVIIGCLFGLLALALYLNEVFFSGYKGFLMVGGGCILVVLLVVMIVTMRGSRSSN
ncbi:MAG: hypothetical protein BGO68_03265 [Candidatus Amoebophilus sp. 36-38]|nr:MAG: hypothetical protein BGO68_03265 [Candidatus Amoebophilus sp. 36-38]